MTTRNSRAPTYADLAKASAVVRRNLPAAACERLQGVVEDLSEVGVELKFSLDEHQRIRMDGFAEATVKLECQLCGEPVPRPLLVQLHGLLASSEAQAMQWREGAQTAADAEDIVVVTAAHLDAAELVEDELLLQLPSQVCVAADCERRPALSYGPEEEPDTETGAKPFAALAQLKLDK